MWVIRYFTAVLPALPLAPGLVARLAGRLAGRLMLGLMLGLAAPAGMARADVIQLRADRWCPFNCTPGSPAPGFMVELVSEALAPFGHKVHYANLGWSRSLAQVHNGEINGVIGTDPDEASDLIFSPPLGQYQEALAFRRGETLTVTTPQDLQALRLGAVQDYEYSDAINDYITEHKNHSHHVQLLTGENSLNRNLRKLLTHRIDVLLEEHSVLLFALKAEGMRDQVEIIPQGEVNLLYIGFSPALESSHLYVTQLHHGLTRLKHTGRYDQILARYGLME